MLKVRHNDLKHISMLQETIAQAISFFNLHCWEESDSESTTPGIVIRLQHGLDSMS